MIDLLEILRKGERHIMRASIFFSYEPTNRSDFSQCSPEFMRIATLRHFFAALQMHSSPSNDGRNTAIRGRSYPRDIRFSIPSRIPHPSTPRVPQVLNWLEPREMTERFPSRWETHRFTSTLPRKPGGVKDLSFGNVFGALMLRFDWKVSISRYGSEIERLGSDSQLEGDRIAGINHRRRSVSRHWGEDSESSI